MPTYIGFSTQQLEQVRKPQYATTIDGGTGTITNPITTRKKFRIVDTDLVLQDFLNSLNIQQGSKPGRPSYGTTLWSYIFEPNVLTVQQAIESEVRRVASLDPRLLVNSVVSYPQEHGILIEVEIAVSPFNVAEVLSIQFDAETGRSTASSSSGTIFTLSPSLAR
jgi:phage baseplate assembly protein W